MSRPFDTEEDIIATIGRREVGWVTTVFVLGLVVVFLMVQNAGLRERNAELADSRVMYGIPNDDGYFVSVTKRPDQIVTDFGESFVLNIYNWQDERTARINFRAALGQMDARYVREVANSLDERATAIGEDLSSQSFIPIELGKLVETARGYSYTVRGAVERYIGRVQESNYELTVTVRMAKVPPTESNQFGLVVIGSDDDGSR